MNLSRRSFLKAVAVATAAAGAPAIFNLVDERQRVVGMIRETVQARIVEGDFIVRFDVRTRDVHFGVDACMGALGDLPKVRDGCIETLIAELERRDIDASDLLPLEKLPWA